MPLQSTLAQTRATNISAALNAALATLTVVSASFKTPFLEPISNTMRSLLTAVQSSYARQTVKNNRDECTRMLEHLHELLYAIILLYITSDATGGELSPTRLSELGRFTETLHKIHTFVEAQQEKSRIKQFFRQGEMSTLLKGCQTGLEQALEVFKVQDAHLLCDVTDMQQYSQKKHQDVLELISSLSDGTSSDGTSMLSRDLSAFHGSSNSLSLLPSEPKIFHGREAEVSTIIELFQRDTPRIAILGGGGMGKTSLARAVIHHPEISSRYDQRRLFVTCDTILTSVQLAGLIGEHLGLKPGKDLIRSVISHFSSGLPSLLVLDNLETIWEPTESRGEVEKFLSLLADIHQLAMVITMRGAERPANVRWTRPFLEPLKPLPQDAARETFITIADDRHSTEDIDKILRLTDNMPLAIDLIAHLVHYEGVARVLGRWETEKTSLLSDGYGKGSNLDFSLSLSLESSRLTALPQSRDLLSLLSILPDGLSDVDLIQSKLPIENILACKTVLLRTALSYMDDQRRLKALVPIREYMKRIHPPTGHLVQPLLKHFTMLLTVYDTYWGTASAAGVVARLASNFSNIQNILHLCLDQDNPDLADAVYSACDLDRFSGRTGRGRIPLMAEIHKVLPQSSDPRLQGYFITQLFAGSLFHPIPNPNELIDQALDHFTHFDDPELKCRFYGTIANYYRFHRSDMSRALEFTQTGLALAIASGNIKREAASLTTLGWIKWQRGAYSEAQKHASQSQRLAKTSADLYQQAEALQVESACWFSLGRYGYSNSLTKTARELLGLCGMSGGELDYSILCNQAEVHYLQSEYLESRAIHTQVLSNSNLEGDLYQHAMALLNIAQINLEVGASKDDVKKTIDTANSIFNTIGFSTGSILCDILYAALRMREGDLFSAKLLLQKYLNFSWGDDIDNVSYCLERLANVNCWRPLNSIPSPSTIIFLIHSLKLKQKLETHKALQFLGDLYSSWGDQKTSSSLYTVALEGFTQMDVHRSRAECMLRLGDISKQGGDMLQAMELWKTARLLFERSSQAKQIAQVDDRLLNIPLELSASLEGLNVAEI
ncbi:hypothetical protein DFH09DRAFT_1454858 [Mycena vulgaris]|nr:hypothetical protein DFH09DRAFT_1454858 [Mycena vulgaris]